VTQESAAASRPSLIAEVESQSTSLSTPCADGDLAWHRWGSGPPMVLLHGGTGSWTHWVRNVLALAGAHTVLVPDMPGFGDSAAPPKGSGVPAIADIVANGIARLAGGPVQLVGFSFGGLVAGHLAAARPELVSRLVLVGAGGLGLRDGKRLPLVAWRHLKDEPEREAAHRHNLANLMLWDAAKIDALALHIQSTNAQRSRINSGPFSRGDVLLDPLSRVKAPIDGIWGRHDTTVGSRMGEVGPILRRTDPHATMTVIEDAGHWVIYERAAEFNRALLESRR
jgi:pimeloyl-ACP methyl ester carboxylesterase